MLFDVLRNLALLKTMKNNLGSVMKPLIETGLLMKVLGSAHDWIQ